LCSVFWACFLQQNPSQWTSKKKRRRKSEMS
jgi:hypothetical protein